MNIKQVLDEKIWAVVGATENHEKYGYKIFKTLKQKGYKVYPINPNYEVVQGEKCYPDLLSLPEVPQVINMVVPPKHGIKVIEEASRLGVKYVWLQPGTVSDELLKTAEQNGLKIIQACVLISV